MGKIKDWLLDTGGPTSNESNSNRRDQSPSTEWRQGIAIVDNGKTITFIDSSFANIFGYEGRNEVLELDLDSLYPQGEIGRLDGEVIPQLEEGEIWEGKATGLKKDEERFNHGLAISKITGNELVWKVKEPFPGQENPHPLMGIEEQISKLRQGLSRLQKLTNEGEILRQTLEVLQDIIDFDFSAIQIVEGGIHVAKSNLNGEEFYRIGEGMAQLTLERGKTLRGENLARYGEFDPRRELFHSFISAPIGDLGVVQVVSKDVNNFTQGDADLLQILTDHLREKLSRVKLEGALKTKAIHDHLTGLYNRHYLTEVLTKEVERADRYNHEISFLMVDVNNFKDVNDSYSHAVGDQVLTEIGSLLRDNVRGPDIVFRYGGDEFLILLPETGEGSEAVIERLQAEMEKWNEENDLVDIPLTLAMGAAKFNPKEDLTVEETIGKADRSMYEDKKNN